MSAALQDELRDTAAAFGPSRLPDRDELFLAALAGDIAGGSDPALALAVEQVYEGYLAHYRTSRALASDVADAPRLLAGDYFYAHGLRSIAAGGDVEAVGLLTQLMASCSFARLEQASLGIDDDLWEMTVIAVAAGRGSPAREAAARAFAAVRSAISGHDLDELAAAAAGGLGAVRGACTSVDRAAGRSSMRSREAGDDGDAARPSSATGRGG